MTVRWRLLFTVSMLIGSAAAPAWSQQTRPALNGGNAGIIPVGAQRATTFTGSVSPNAPAGNQARVGEVYAPPA